jgi:dipeptidyl aminopeptidase/acylaminoacyl peptidase
MRPPGTPAGPTPLILNIHGGPHGSHGLGFHLEWQAQAAAGRAVLFINPRGSNGYGQAFTRGCINDWGGKDFQDLMAGVDAAIAQGGIDPARLVVTGISYGGFMTSWTIGHTDRFAAAIPEMLVGNLVSFFGTSDVGTWFIPEEVAGDPFAGVEKAWHHSPLAHLDHATTPTLVIEGEADWRCPIEQGEQVYATLLKRGVEAALARFPNASHGFSHFGPPSARLRRQRLVSAWMDRHAKT